MTCNFQWSFSESVLNSIVVVFVFNFITLTLINNTSMAELGGQEVDIPIAFRRKTRDLKDVQDVLKSVVQSGGQ